ncbi:MAG: competence/damage-inducible protein A [Vulcanimicrobiota bacterium]
MQPATACLIIIGNEILTGRVVDENTPFLTRRLTELGVDVREVRILPDELEIIAAAVTKASAEHTYVLTSGGIGPTHDDLTIDAVAHAFGRQVVTSPGLERLLKLYYKVDELSLAQNRLASIPEGAELIYPEGANYPQVVIANVYIFPGIPELLRKKFEQIAYLFQGPPSFETRLLFAAHETDIAAMLHKIANDNPKVRIGSYPKHLEGVWKVELVLESREAGEVERVEALLKSELELET